MSTKGSKRRESQGQQKHKKPKISNDHTNLSESNFLLVNSFESNQKIPDIDPEHLLETWLYPLKKDGK
jgi:hypothetical protein